jgi:hypothetical protein
MRRGYLEYLGAPRSSGFKGTGADDMPLRDMTRCPFPTHRLPPFALSLFREADISKQTGHNSLT